MKRVRQQFLELRKACEKKEDVLPFLERMEYVDIASFLSQENQYILPLLSVLIQSQKAAGVLAELPEEKLTTVCKQMSKNQVEGLFQSSQVDELVYLLQFFPEEEQSVIILNSPRKTQIQKFLKYSENQAGRIMQSPAFALPADMTAVEGIEKLRQRSIEEFIFYIYCIDNKGRLIGVVSLRQAATAPANTPLKELMKKDVVSVQAKAVTRETAKIASHYEFLALPVVDENQKLLGVITMDDIIDIIQEQNTANIYARAGLQTEEKIHTHPWVSLKNRLPWMGLNLLLAVLASSVISLFEQTMSRLIILASLKNIVASLGGNTAIQTLTVTTRGMAVGDFRFTPFTQSLIKEMIVGFCMGVVMGLGSAVITYFWKGSLLVSVVIFIAMVLNFMMAVIMGSIIPIVLSFFRRDPAVGSGVIVTMITDIFGFFTFLAIAHYGLALSGASL